LKSDTGKDTLTGLIARADVLIENFRSGVLDRLGFSTTRCMEINPRLVILSITGFGHDGPEASRAGYDQIAQGEAGLMSLTGSGPDDMQRVGVPIADLLAGIYGSYGVLAALLERERTGRGKVVRTSLIAGMVGVHAFQGTRATVAGQEPQPGGNHHPSLSPYGLFNCRDGAVQISVGNESLWQRFCAAFDIDPATEGLADNASRVANRPRLIELIEEKFSAFGSEELLTALTEAGIPPGPARPPPEPRARAPPAPPGRCHRGEVLRLRLGGAAHRTARGGRPLGHGAPPARGLRVGPGTQPGSQGLRRPPGARRHRPARPAAAVLRRLRR